jgi:hypothetical protein
LSFATRPDDEIAAAIESAIPIRNVVTLTTSMGRLTQQLILLSTYIRQSHSITKPQEE